MVIETVATVAPAGAPETTRADGKGDASFVAEPLVAAKSTVAVAPPVQVTVGGVVPVLVVQPPLAEAVETASANPTTAK
jgi:hypothetical protein